MLLYSTNSLSNNDNAIFFDSLEIKKIIKQADNRKINRIYFSRNNEEFILLKIKKQWIPYNKFVLNIAFINETKKTINLKNIKLPKIKSDNNSKNFFDRGVFKYSENVFEEKINFILKDNLLSLLDIYDNYAFYEKWNNKDIETEKFYELLSSDKKIEGIEKTSFSQLAENTHKLVLNKGEAYFIKEQDLYVLTITTGGSKAVNRHYCNSTSQNIYNNLNQEYTSKPKLNTKNAFLSIIGFLIIVALFYVTINHIFGLVEIKDSFKIIGDETTLSQPWIYLLFSNFIFTYFFSLILTILLDLIFNKSKTNVKRLSMWFVGGQVRTTAMFLTGNYFISTVFWAYYLNKKSQIRVSSLVGSIGSIGLIKAILLLITGIIFLTPGTIYLSDSYLTTSESSIVFLLGWGGMLYLVFHDAAMSLIVFLPILQILYVKIKLNLVLKKNNSIDAIYSINNEVQFVKNSFNTIFKNKARLIRIFCLVFIMVFFEAIETSMIFQMVENYQQKYYINLSNLSAEANYWNFMELAGARFISSYVHHFPGLGLLPGQGLGITDQIMKNINEVIIAKQHHLNLDEFNLSFSNIEIYSKQVTFINRFLNFYLNKTLSLIITIGAIIAMFKRMIFNKSKVKIKGLI